MEWKSEFRDLSAEAIAENGTRYWIGTIDNDAEIVGYYPQCSWSGETFDNIEEAKAAAEQHDGGWLPIEKAPKDGTKIVLAAHTGLAWETVSDCHWLADDEVWWTDAVTAFSCVGAMPDFIPTHWRFLPTPPEGK